VEKSEACVIMTEKYQQDPYFVDYTNIFTFLSIKKHLNLVRKERKALPIIIQLIKPENKKHLNAITQTSDDSYNVIVGGSLNTINLQRVTSLTS
jgi:hypothetical protein